MGRITLTTIKRDYSQPIFIKINLIGTLPVLLNAVNLVTNQEGKSDWLLTAV
jgi:enolase